MRKIANPPLVIGLIVIVALGLLPILLPRQNHQAEEMQTNAAQASSVGGRAVIDAEGAIVDQSPGKGGDQYAAEDLRAQESMAYAAWAMFIATLAGVGLLLATLLETRQAGKAIADTLTQTKRQADVAEESYRRLERPYLYVIITDDSGLGFSYSNAVRMAGARELKPALTYGLVNYGKTPAVFRSIFLELRPLEQLDFMNGRPLVALNVPRKEWHEVIPPEDSVGGRTLEVLGSVPGERIPENVSLALHGVLTYEDMARTLYTHHFVLVRRYGRFVLEYSQNDADREAGAA